ncbi:MAG: hypothetical protein O7C67_08875, partial [Gammaproteobacteria bacterium]|nr:hypothetical protein [Gammaproteobacteria bacterium]
MVIKRGGDGVHRREPCVVAALDARDVRLAEAGALGELGLSEATEFAPHFDRVLAGRETAHEVVGQQNAGVDERLARGVRVLIVFGGGAQTCVGTPGDRASVMEGGRRQRPITKYLGSSLILEPDAGPAAVFIDEFDAGVFEGTLDLPDVYGVPLHWSIIAFHPPNRR